VGWSRRADSVSGWVDLRFRVGDVRGLPDADAGVVDLVLGHQHESTPPVTNPTMHTSLRGYSTTTALSKRFWRFVSAFAIWRTIE
jgi:hypothetical protein